MVVRHREGNRVTESAKVTFSRLCWFPALWVEGEGVKVRTM